MAFTCTNRQKDRRWAYLFACFSRLGRRAGRWQKVCGVAEGLRAGGAAGTEQAGVACWASSRRGGPPACGSSTAAGRRCCHRGMPGSDPGPAHLGLQAVEPNGQPRELAGGGYLGGRRQGGGRRPRHLLVNLHIPRASRCLYSLAACPASPNREGSNKYEQPSIVDGWLPPPPLPPTGTGRPAIQPAHRGTAPTCGSVLARSPELPCPSITPGVRSIGGAQTETLRRPGGAVGRTVVTWSRGVCSARWPIRECWVAAGGV